MLLWYIQMLCILLWWVHYYCYSQIAFIHKVNNFHEYTPIYVSTSLSLKSSFIEVQLIYNVVLVSSEPQSESYMCVYTHTHAYVCAYPSLWDSLPIQVTRVFSRVACAWQQVLISYLFYIQQCVYVNPSLPIYHPPITVSLFSTSLTQFPLCKQVLFTIFQISHISDIILVFLCLTYLV